MDQPFHQASDCRLETKTCLVIATRSAAKRTKPATQNKHRGLFLFCGKAYLADSACEEST